MVLGADQGSEGAAVGRMAALPRVGAGVAAGGGGGGGAPGGGRGGARGAGGRAGAGGGGGAAAAGRAAVPGSQLWVSRFNGPAASTGGFARAVAVSPDGATVFVTGVNYFGRGPDYGTVAYDAATGAQRWASRYN